jgi:GNAT superfamily N-acetyltransferase
MQNQYSNIAGATAPFAIHRYPTQWIESATLADGRSVLVRPVLPQDAELQQAFVRSLTPLTRRRRFHGPLNELPAATARYMTEVDYRSHFALLAEAHEGGDAHQVAEARWVRRADEPQVADFALAVADDWQGAGLGARLMQLLKRSAAAAGVNRLAGDILLDNLPMRTWLRRTGWRFSLDPEDPAVLAVELDLARRPEPASIERLAA